MTSFLRNAFLALVAFATLAIIVMMAVTAEAKDLKPTADAATAPDQTRQIVVEAITSKTPSAPPVAEKPAEVKPVADGSADAQADSAPPAPEAPAAEATPQPQSEPAPEAEQPAPKSHTNTHVYGYVAYVQPRYGYGHSYGQDYGYGRSAGYGYGSSYGHSSGYDHCD